MNVMAKKTTDQEWKPTQEDIARRAYEIFEQCGRPQGRDLDHWLKAEGQLKSARQGTEQRGNPVGITTKPLQRQPLRSS
jgi:hypothetical protein